MIVGLNTDDDAKRTVYGSMMEPPTRARDIFYNYYANLTSVLGYDVENLLPQLIGQRVLSNNDAEIIRKTVSPSEKAGKLLSIIAGPLDAGSQGSFEKLLHVMANNGNGETRDEALQIMKEVGITPEASSKQRAPHSFNSKLSCITQQSTQPILRSYAPIICKPHYIILSSGWGFDQANE